MKKLLCLILLFSFQMAFAQVPQTDATTPLHKLAPNYPVPYGIPKQEDVNAVIERVYGYLNSSTPTGFINEKTGEPVTDLSKIDADTILARGDFRIVSYEWGVTYAGMLLATEATTDRKYRDYVEKRLTFIANSADKFKNTSAQSDF